MTIPLDVVERIVDEEYERPAPVPESAADGLASEAQRAARRSVRAFSENLSSSRARFLFAPLFVSSPFSSQILEAAKQHRIDPALIAAVIRAESNGFPRAVSRKGARGLMQLMPATARRLGVKSRVRPAGEHPGGHGLPCRARRAIRRDERGPDPRGLQRGRARGRGVRRRSALPRDARLRQTRSRALGLAGAVTLGALTRCFASLRAFLVVAPAAFVLVLVAFLAAHSRAAESFVPYPLLADALGAAPLKAALRAVHRRRRSCFSSLPTSCRASCCSSPTLGVSAAAPLWSRGRGRRRRRVDTSGEPLGIPLDHGSRRAWCSASPCTAWRTAVTCRAGSTWGPCSSRSPRSRP